jgi:hypothetical protein
MNNTDIKYWIFSSNPEQYDAIENFEIYENIYWENPSNNKIEIDDIVYIYISRPIQKIAIKTQVLKTNITREEVIEDTEDEIVSDNDNFVLLGLIQFIDSEFLSLKYLNQNGIDGNIHGKRTISQSSLEYIAYHENDNISSNAIKIEELEKELEKKILHSKYSSLKDIEARLEKADKYPESIEIVSRGFKRNSDVIVTVLNRANGFCEKCGNKAPFIRKKDNTPYLEVHHIKRLADGGEDSVDNTIAVCPNCHRELHYGV